MNRVNPGDVFSLSLDKYIDRYIEQLALIAARGDHFARLSKDLTDKVMLFDAFNHYSQDELDAIVQAWREKEIKARAAAEKQRLKTEKKARLKLRQQKKGSVKHTMKASGG